MLPTHRPEFRLCLIKGLAHASLLTAVNLGGLGTLVASLASLISYQYYSKEYPGHSGSFLRAFTRWNLLFLAVLVIAALLMGA